MPRSKTGLPCFLSHRTEEQKFNFAQGSSVDPIFRLCPEMKEQVDIDGLTWVALNFFFGCKIKPTEIVPSEIEQPRKWTLKK